MHLIEIMKNLLPLLALMIALLPPGVSAQECRFQKSSGVDAITGEPVNLLFPYRITGSQPACTCGDVDIRYEEATFLGFKLDVCVPSPRYEEESTPSPSGYRLDERLSDLVVNGKCTFDEDRCNSFCDKAYPGFLNSSKRIECKKYFTSTVREFLLATMLFQELLETLLASHGDICGADMCAKFDSNSNDILEWDEFKALINTPAVGQLIEKYSVCLKMLKLALALGKDRFPTIHCSQFGDEYRRVNSQMFGFFSDSAPSSVKEAMEKMPENAPELLSCANHILPVMRDLFRNTQLQNFGSCSYLACENSACRYFNGFRRKNGPGCDLQNARTGTACGPTATPTANPTPSVLSPTPNIDKTVSPIPTTLPSPAASFTPALSPTAIAPVSPSATGPR